MARFVQSRRSALSGDDGVALITAVAVAALVAVLGITLLTISLAESRSSGRERQRAEAVAFAEGQVDMTLARVQAAAPASLPCTSTASSTVSRPDTLTAQTTVRYYDRTRPAGTEDVTSLVCSGSAPAVTEALVSSTTTSQALGTAPGASRKVETLIALKPRVDGLDKAIFGNAGIALANNGEVFGRTGVPDADIYTNGDFACNNNQDYHGSIYAQGSITMSSTCTVDVDAWAGTRFTANNTGVTVKGDVRVGNGGAAMDARGATVAGTVSVRTTITGSQWRGDNCPAKCVEGANPGMPPAIPFPQIPWNPTVQAAWAAAPPAGGGFTTVVDTAATRDCTVSGDANGPGRWIMDNAASLTSPTLLRTPCRVVIQRNNNTLALGNNLAVFADGGVALANSITIRSTSSTVRNLYFIQPYNAVASPCTTDGIVLDNRVTLESTVDLLLYSPCNIRKANNADHFGQVYAGGNAVIDNQFTMYYKPLPVWGIANPVVRGYDIDILYKRENF
ncbi:hypothetical protein [Aquipuribacter nitratireducens]|uniref:Uncharacterized protein n=1 Tax=Aquipuribacter nitratireducens TaxID=650104 RepID=A0ABW0GU80_9MICO